ncbi:MAG: preprotein translocase subunit SecA [Gemmataceae bacterium]|nr:preprotein translocase subunit SecA [Gemmataceae bacterium]
MGCFLPGFQGWNLTIAPLNKALDHAPFEEGRGEVRNRDDRFAPAWQNYLLKWFGLPWQRILARAALVVPKVRHYEKIYSAKSDFEILEVAKKFKGRARGGESLEKMLPEVFGMVCVECQRVLGLRPFDVQIAAGSVIHEGALAELATGEGKTLVAAMPAVLNALAGKGVHVSSVNDYLSKRDGEWLTPLFRAMGLTTGILQQQIPDGQRQQAYQADITYGTASEFGFDFLRDRLKTAQSHGAETPFWDHWLAQGKPQASGLVQRGHHFALVDEADNIFIDEARTPLIISGQVRPATAEEQIIYHWADELAQRMEASQHFQMNPQNQKLELSALGKHLVRYSNPPSGPHGDALDKLHEAMEQALQAHYRFKLNQHYLVEKNKIIIIDEFTGRRMPDRHWRDGLHQAVEAKEKVPVTHAEEHAAQITFQSYYRLYKKLSGMSGTAVQNRWEVRRVYKIWVAQVPTNQPVIREPWPDRVFPTEGAKFDAVVDEVQRLKALGRPVLIGTRSVEISESLSEKLQQAGIDHQVLNAKNHEREAKIIEEAGLIGRVTIATNMAGRGTDIKPGRDVIAAGGLHVLGTERHEALRIDRQLAGRSGRQGDPGSAQFFLSLDDELLEGMGEHKQEQLRQIGLSKANKNWGSYLRFFQKAQLRVEARHFTSRVDLLVHEKQRQEILKDLGADPYVD